MKPRGVIQADQPLMTPKLVRHRTFALVDILQPDRTVGLQMIVKHVQTGRHVGMLPAVQATTVAMNLAHHISTQMVIVQA